MFKVELECLNRVDEDSEYFFYITLVDDPEVVVFVPTGHTEQIEGIDFKKLKTWPLVNFIVEAINEKTDRAKEKNKP